MEPSVVAAPSSIASVLVNGIPVEAITPVTSAVGVGRPTVMTPQVIAKLEEAFLFGATDLQACFLAGISKDAFYDYCKENPSFSDKKEALKDSPKITAKKIIVKSLDAGDEDMAKWYAERKIKDEFSPRTDVNLDANINGPSILRLDS